MLNDLENKIENLFLSKTKTLQKEALEKIIYDLYNNVLVEQSQTQKQISQAAKQILSLLPKFEFNEKTVGQVTSEDRKKILMFFGSKVAGKQSIEEVLKSINLANSNFAKSQTSKEALSSLMLLKILKNILVGSSPGPSGYAFESFLAALLGGKQVPVEAGGIVDVVVGSTKYQIKFISPNRDVYIKRNSIEQFGIKSKKSQQVQNTLILDFIIATKNSDSEIEFFTFQETKENILKNITGNSYIIRKQFYKNKSVGKITLSDEMFAILSQKLEDGLKNTLLETSKLIDNVNLFYFNNDTTAAEKGITNTDRISTLLTSQLNK